MGLGGPVGLWGGVLEDIPHSGTMETPSGGSWDWTGGVAGSWGGLECHGPLC